MLASPQPEVVATPEQVVAHTHLVNKTRVERLRKEASRRTILILISEKTGNNSIHSAKCSNA